MYNSILEQYKDSYSEMISEANNLTHVKKDPPWDAESGVKGDGVWKKGTWKDGIWNAGTWKDGTWKDGVWFDGTWKGGTWKDGVWYEGKWEGGTWAGGTWIKGWIRNPGNDRMEFSNSNPAVVWPEHYA